MAMNNQFVSKQAEASSGWIERVGSRAVRIAEGDKNSSDYSIAERLNLHKVHDRRNKEKILVFCCPL